MFTFECSFMFSKYEFFVSCVIFKYSLQVCSYFHSLIVGFYTAIFYDLQMINIFLWTGKQRRDFFARILNSTLESRGTVQVRLQDKKTRYKISEVR